MLNGGYNAWDVASKPADELLAQLKTALSSLEYVSNFGVTPEYQKLHPLKLCFIPRQDCLGLSAQRT